MNSEGIATKGYSFLKEGEGLVDRQLYQVPVGELEQNSEQPRKHFDGGSLAEMRVSIEKHVVLQPVIVQKGGDGQLVIVSGERRFRAAQAAGKETVPAIYHDGSDSAVIALVENLLREDLTPVEEAEALQKLKGERGYTQEQISEVIGKAVPTISEILALAKLHEGIRDECRADRRFSRRNLLEVVRKDTPEKVQKAYEALKSKMAKTEDKRTKEKVEVDPAEAWVKKVDKFRTSLEKVDFSSLGDRRGDVEGALGVLLAVIKRTVPVEV